MNGQIHGSVGRVKAHSKYKVKKLKSVEIEYNDKSKSNVHLDLQTY